jgi:hypothetical protein
MPPEKPPNKLKCPECDTELVLVNEEAPEECPKCGFVLAGWDGFGRWMKAYLKLNPITPVPPPPLPDPIKKPRKRSFLNNLARKPKNNHETIS